MPATKDIEMSVYEPPDSKVQLSLRVPLSVRVGLEAVVRLWRIYAESRDDDSKPIDMTFALVRLLRVGIDQAFHEVGGRPESEADWASLEKRLRSAGRGSSK